MDNTSNVLENMGVAESVSKHKRNSGYAWFLLIICILASFSFITVDRVISPAMATILEQFGMDTVWGGSLSSIMGMMTMILVIPLGALFTRFSAKWMAIIGLAVIAIGAFGAAASDTAGMFYAMRFVQGFGYAVMTVVGATMVTRWFDEEHRGLPMGLYQCNGGIGGFLINFYATPIMNQSGWQGLFTVVGIWSAISVVLYIFFVKDWPAEGKSIDVGKNKPVKKAKLSDTFKTPSIWAMALIFLMLGMGQQGVGTFMPMILTQLAGADSGTANLMNSILSLAVLASSIYAGGLYQVITRKDKSKRGFFVLICVILGVATQFTLLTFVNDLGSGWFWMLLWGLIGLLWMSPLFVLSAEHARTPALASLGLTIFMFGQQLGGAIGPIALGWVNTSFGGFAVARWYVLIVGIIGIFAAVYVMTKDKKFVAQESNSTRENVE